MAVEVQVLFWAPFPTQAKQYKPDENNPVKGFFRFWGLYLSSPMPHQPVGDNPCNNITISPLSKPHEQGHPAVFHQALC
ncbi:MAG: hypothetical protein R3204_05200 [Oceanospirillum sp.]|nr:hypothetical protein [Oceanospirillum sp.]